jgi:farnesyl diphosphate synthase
MPSPRQASPELTKAIEESATDVNKTIEHLLPEADLPEAPLYDSMRYSVLNGGKRLRPFLVLNSAKLFNVDSIRARRVAAALEFVHCYSLVHDDLPAMDDADKRRGKASLHKEYDEATAILAGDALLTLAFEVLASDETHPDPRVRIELVSALAKASGGHGMVGGQMLDLIGEGKQFDVGTISRLQRMKTGMLMAFACEAGAILGRSDEPHRKALRSFAFDLGLAFQVTDDILDVEGNAEEMGKDVGKDTEAGKATFVSTMGREGAQSRAEMLIAQAKRHLHVFSGRAKMLEEIAEYVLERRA